MYFSGHEYVESRSTRAKCRFRDPPAAKLGIFKKNLLERKNLTDPDPYLWLMFVAFWWVFQIEMRIITVKSKLFFTKQHVSSIRIKTISSKIFCCKFPGVSNRMCYGWWGDRMRQGIKWRYVQLHLGLRSLQYHTSMEELCNDNIYCKIWPFPGDFFWLQTRVFVLISWQLIQDNTGIVKWKKQVNIIVVE